MDFPITSIVIFLPLIGAVVTMLARSDQAVRYAALATTTVTFLLSLLFWTGFDAAAPAGGLQFVDATGPFISEAFDIKYIVGID
ncbi:MAG: Fe-S-binding domain-containing protein, partial [Rhodothermales bacterium]